MTEWRQQAACREMDPALFFPERNPPRAVFEICEGCPVRAECADAGKTERYGIWGGQSMQPGTMRRRAA